MKILIADDEKDIRNLIKLYLANENYEFIEAENGLEAIQKMDSSIDLVLLDIMMPIMDGTQVCVEIRKSYTTPIIFLTAKDDDTDKYIGFNSGGDDYITKPFNPIDMTLRIKAHIRRYRVYEQGNENIEEIEIGSLVVNLASKTIFKDGNVINLTKIEFSILELFLKNRKRVFSLEHIYENVWGDKSILNAASTVSVHIRNLRNKIEDDITDPKYIKTVWGSGYRVD